MRVWRYVLATDNGTAPNYLPPCLTLALCKPKVRRCAQSGDLVIAFAGRNFRQHPDAVMWAGVVSETLTFAEYWIDPRFQSKKMQPPIVGDNIYEPHPAEPEVYRQHPHAHHASSSARTDLGGRKVLIFSNPDVWVYREAPRVLPSSFALSMGKGRRGERCTDIDGPSADRLHAWLSERPSLAPENMFTAAPSVACAPHRRTPPRHNRGC